MKDLNWSELPFGYVKTDYNVRCTFKNGKWGEIEVSDSEYMNIHIAATCLHYGQEAFEGLKAYRGKDGKVRLFRWDENCKRLQSSAEGIIMEKVDDDLFYKMLIKVIELNKDYIPPYGTGASLYIRPLLIGTGPKVGVQPADEYTIMIFVTPVGPYFKEGFNLTKIGIIRDSDRAAPLGTGTIKIGGNYAASLRGTIKAHKAGCGAPMYLDCIERKYIDEIGAANFFGIKNNTYITPKSTSILPSITNKSIEELAKYLGYNVERRPVELAELETFEEVGACGTAAIISPIGQIIDLDTGKTYSFCSDGKAGPVSTKLYQTLTGIQYGEIEDPFGWVTILENL
jgi:branched-chain amino acid aminotransferase